ncbi:GAF and ANTAR domain-containing protein [Amycolatopsis regifaucium]|uniref:Transcriptional regulator n=1 Tax=Amycolatopsis regifaucium TaxID=546365 RepID=A0A154MHY4_9PSEU|nr:GAF and ANTAR domain-containing protein [Amycolatopsis regifaucium]KZB83753.1 transcriptional regulator [Amycolatopsis regifaucium]OKA06807.1 transcriptional regulator [Amycolatopsis regifaucium]SFH27142.1 GAF domain-containing protein [Amycolatopsis regifaucium]
MKQSHDGPWPAVLDEVTGALETLTSILATEEDFTVLLHRMCDQVVHAVPHVDEATITLLRDHHPTTAASTSEVVTALDHDQYDLGEGPCIQAAGNGKLMRVSITDAAEKWPKFARDADTAGFGSFLSAPLVIGDGHSGAVNCYSGHLGGFAELDEKLLDLYTSATTALLRVYTRYQRARDTADQLRTAMNNRAVIDQAKGILMASRQISADDAFTLLVEQSQRENTKLRDVAIRFVAHATGPIPA